MKYTPTPWIMDDRVRSIYGIHTDSKKAVKVKIADIRGWGALTGLDSTYALGMSDEEAYEVQKANAETIIHRVNGYEALEQRVQELEEALEGVTNSLKVYVNDAHVRAKQEGVYVVTHPTKRKIEIAEQALKKGEV